MSVRRRPAGRGVFAAALLCIGLAAAPAGSAAAEPEPADDCVVSEVLVNPCHPWLGAVVDHYPGLHTWRDQVLGHEQRIGREVDVVHQYHQSSQVSLTADERYFAERGTILYLNWKPAEVWADAAGGDASVNRHIDQMAASIRTLGDTKIILALFGEPERYVTPGTSDCPRLKGAAGSPADYLAMWANVQDRFAAVGVDNVVWAMNYLGYHGWDCLFPELWPGNDRVDWIFWDPYVGPYQTWDHEVGYFYRAMERKADATHDYTAKPWGLAEYGYWYGTADQQDAYRMYDDATTALRAGTYPRLKLYEVYDTVSKSLDIRTQYSGTGALDPVEQEHYSDFANDPVFVEDTPVTDHFAACDTGVESGLSCFAGSYGDGAPPRWHGGDGHGGDGRRGDGHGGDGHGGEGHGGSHSVQVKNSTDSPAELGLTTLTPAVASTQAGAAYSAGVWVRTKQSGLPVQLQLSELRPDGSAPADGDTVTTWVAADGKWHLLAAAYTAAEDANVLTYSVYGTGLAPGQWLRADDFSLTSTGPD